MIAHIMSTMILQKTYAWLVTKIKSEIQRITHHALKKHNVQIHRNL